MGSTTMIVYIYLSYKVYRYKAKLAARNVHAYTLTSAIRGTTSIIATNVHHLQTINLQPLDRRGDNVENQNERRKILIGDKPKSSASHGYILILVIMCNHSLIFVYVKHNASNTEIFLNRNVL